MKPAEDQNPNIQVEITDPSEFHCFRLTLNPKAPPEPYCTTHGRDECDGLRPSCVVMPPRIEIMLHARSLVDLIHKCSLALCDWQAESSAKLIELLTGLESKP